MACNSLGTQYVFWRIRRDDKLGTQSNTQKLLGYLVRKDLDKKGTNYIRLFSVIFSLNVAVGNVSLSHVSVNFNQVMRSLVPVVTIVMGLIVGRQFTWQRITSVVPIVVGVAMACYGDMAFTKIGFFYTAACVVIAALKVTLAGEMLTGNLKLHPVDLLCHLAPLAMVQCISLSVATGEVKAILQRPELYLTDIRPMAVVILSGICSFSLNITSLMTNKLTSPLTLTIAGNVKQVLMIVISTILFSTPVLLLNGIGIIVVLIGSAIYSLISLKEKRAAEEKQSVVSSQMNALEEGDDTQALLKPMSSLFHARTV
jgi:drug/metabolite transporter (DMT)-like permease